MNTANTTLALNAVIGALVNGTTMLAVIQQAHAQGRDLSDAEVQQFLSNDSGAKQQLQAAIDARTAGSSPPAP